MALVFAEEVAIFAETNLGTRIVMTVPLDITTADFKRKLEKTHASCLPSLGEIRVHGLMKLGLLPDHKSQAYPTALINPKLDIAPVLISPLKTKKSLAKPIPKPDPRKSASLDKREFLCSFTTEPETIVRSSLSTARAAELNNSECFNSFIPKTPERETGESVSISETISKKLIVAANNIRMQGKSRMSCSQSSSIFRSKTRRKRSLDGRTLTSLAKFVVFEIPDTLRIESLREGEIHCARSGFV